MRVFNALFATLTSLLLAAVIVFSAGTFIGGSAGAPREVAVTLAPVLPAAPRLVLDRPGRLAAPMATITPCLEAPEPLARAR